MLGFLESGDWPFGSFLEGDPSREKVEEEFYDSIDYDRLTRMRNDLRLYNLTSPEVEEVDGEFVAYVQASKMGETRRVLLGRYEDGEWELDYGEQLT